MLVKNIPGRIQLTVVMEIKKGRPNKFYSNTLEKIVC